MLWLEKLNAQAQVRGLRRGASVQGSCFHEIWSGGGDIPLLGSIILIKPTAYGGICTWCWSFARDLGTEVSRNWCIVWGIQKVERKPPEHMEQGDGPSVELPPHWHFCPLQQEAALGESWKHFPRKENPTSFKIFLNFWNSVFISFPCRPIPQAAAE